MNLLPAIFINSKGRVIKDNVRSAGIIMALDGKNFYQAIKVGEIYIYFPIKYLSKYL